MTHSPDADPVSAEEQRRLAANADASARALHDHQADSADVHHNLSLDQTTELQLANEQLVLAALHAETIAEQAVSHLDELSRSLQHDPLTGTPNRALMLDRLENAIALAQRHRARIAVLFLDLDEFKQINDTLGHAVGDAVVQLVARLLESVVRHSDTVSRHGGDEFLVLMAEISQPSDAALIAEKILVVLAAPSQIDNHPISLSASLGIAVFPEDGDDAATLITRADAAMYRCKRRGGGDFQFFSIETFHARNLPPPPAEDRQDLSTVAQPATHGAPGDPSDQFALGVSKQRQRDEQAARKHRRQIRSMAIVADQLRSPLMAIKTGAGLLNRVSSVGMVEEMQNLIERQVTDMSRLVEDLLDCARGSTGELRVRMSTVDIVDVLGSTVAACLPAITARHQRLTMRLPPSPLHLQGDPTRLAQIFWNLLDNASRYTPDGGAIDLAGLARGDAVEIVVSDNGIGIAQSALADIFDTFDNDGHQAAIRSGGPGIGLAVVRELVEAHGGKIAARSAGENLGSEFIVTLPIRDTPAAGHT